MITVYHIPSNLFEEFYSIRFGKLYGKNTEEWAKEHFKQYVKVAKVDTDDLETAFERTNSLNKHWYENAGIVEVFVPRPRSSVVGDIFVVNGKEYAMVSPYGFTTLTIEKEGE